MPREVSVVVVFLNTRRGHVTDVNIRSPGGHKHYVASEACHSVHMVLGHRVCLLPDAYRLALEPCHAPIHPESFHTRWRPNELHSCLNTDFPNSKDWTCQFTFILGIFTLTASR